MAKSSLFLIVLIFFSCAGYLRDDHREESSHETVEESILKLRTLALEEDYKELRRAGNHHLSNYGDESRSDEVRLLVASADIELGFYDEALSVLSPITAGDGPDGTRGRAYMLRAEIEQARGLFADATESLLAALMFKLDESSSLKARLATSEVVELLSRDELERIIEANASSAGIDILLRENLSFAQAVGDTAAARRIIDQLGTIAPEVPDPGEVLEADMTVPASFKTRVQERAPFRIGLLCPLNGRFSPIGEAFLQGASMAVKEVRKQGLFDMELVVGDTRADPLTARSAVERLIKEEGVIAVVGGVLSAPTIAAAQVAEYNRTVLVSPVATKEGIADIGDWIFQTIGDNQDEVTAVAILACRELGLRRIAFLSVDDVRSRRLELLFRSEIERLGGEVCISEFYAEGNSDFHENIERIRNADSEALFIASDAEDVILILPQLSFYEFGVQLLGTEKWNSNRLILMAGRDMEGAIFPASSDARRDEEIYLTAAAAIGEPVDEVNQFVIGGYKGVRTLLSALMRTRDGGDALRDELIRTLDNRRHPFLELFSGRGISFYTVRNERIEEFITLKASQ